MPTYEYRCPKCDHPFEVILRITESETPQKCPMCKKVSVREFRTAPNFNLDGDNWPSKAGRIRDQKKLHNAKLDIKQAERAREQPGVRLVPNVGGERVESWADAKKLAKDKGKSTDSYNSYVHKEQQD